MFEREGKSRPGSRLEVVEFRSLDKSLFEIIATILPGAHVYPETIGRG
jgi:hypothetical protein